MLFTLGLTLAPLAVV